MVSAWRILSSQPEKRWRHQPGPRNDLAALASLSSKLFGPLLPWPVLVQQLGWEDVESGLLVLLLSRRLGNDFDSFTELCSAAWWMTRDTCKEMSECIFPDQGPDVFLHDSKFLSANWLRLSNLIYISVYREIYTYIYIYTHTHHTHTHTSHTHTHWLDWF